ncbi:MAG TPA: CopD family protein [Acidimicrobiia bacterium]
MIHPTVATLRLFLHVLAATIWVGGQLTLAGLVPTARTISPGAPRTLAHRFAQLAWPAYGVLILTGIWNITAVHPVWDSTYGTTLIIKLAVVALSGIAAWAHSASSTPRAIAVWGAISGLSAVLALLLGVMLHG